MTVNRARQAASALRAAFAASGSTGATGGQWQSPHFIGVSVDGAMTVVALAFRAVASTCGSASWTTSKTSASRMVCRVLPYGRNFGPTHRPK